MAHPEKQYLDLMQELLDTGDRQVDAGHGKATIGVFGRQMRFDLSEGFPLLTTKKVYWKGVLHELYWFLSGQSNIRYLVQNDVHIWDDYPYRLYAELAKKGEVTELSKEEFVFNIANDKSFADEYGELPRIYGEMWRRWPAKDGRQIDQLQWVVDELKNDPSCHNAIVTSWNPEYLYSMAKPEEVNHFPICHNMYQLNIKNGKVSLQLYQRSADIFLGVPFNIASYALLAMIIAKIVGRAAGDFVHTFGDVHYYEDHETAIRQQLEREPKAFPKIIISDEVTSLATFRPEHVTLEGYDPHPPIKAELTVAGLRSLDNKPIK
jgi:thymidylate synthase